jgi:hypothetical protein
MWVRGHRNCGGIDQLPEPFNLLRQPKRRNLPPDFPQDPVDVATSPPNRLEPGVTVSSHEPRSGIVDWSRFASHLVYLDSREVQVEPGSNP